MSVMSEGVKRFVVQRLACFDAPSEIVDAVKAEFDVAVSRQQVHFYDPEHGQPSEKWKAIYDATRKEFLASTARLAIAQKPFRLRELEKLFRHATTGKVKNVILAASLLEQAAKEAGDAYTNRRVIEPVDPAAALASLLGVTVDEVHTAVNGVGAGAP